jgi:perosamine synthetase
VLTHTYGVPTPEVEIIASECRQRKWILIEDISECVGVSVRTKSSGNQLLGTFGDFGCASLYANKIIHGGDGGFIVAKDAILTARLKALVNHGFTPNYHFLHFESAINAKINGLGAALVCGCLDRMSAVLYHRQLLSQWYRQYLKSLPIELMPECGPSDTPWVFGIVCPTKRIRRELRAHLAEYGVESRDFFYPLHFQPAFRHISTERRYPRAE